MSWALLVQLAPFLAPLVVAALGTGGWIGLRRGRAESLKGFREADVLSQQIYQNALNLAQANHEAVMARLAEMELRMSDLGFRAGRAEMEARKVHRWIGEGAPPPPPVVPSWLFLPAEFDVSDGV